MNRIRSFPQIPLWEMNLKKVAKYLASLINWRKDFLTLLRQREPFLTAVVNSEANCVKFWFNFHSGFTWYLYFFSKSVGTQLFNLLHLFIGFCVILVGMQARITKRKNRDGSVREYLQIVRSVRKPDKKYPSHEVIANLGRMDLIKEGHIDTLVQNLAQFTLRSKVLDLEQDFFHGGCKPWTSNNPWTHMEEIGIAVYSG